MNLYRLRFISRLYEPPIVVFAWLASVKERKGFIFKFSKWREGRSRAIQTAIMDTQFS